MKRSLLSLILLMVAMQAPAQDIGPCRRTETKDGCFSRLQPAGVVILTADETAAVLAKVAAEPTGTPTLQLPTGTSKRDFLSLLAASASNATVDAKGTTYTIDWNLPFRVFDADDKVKLQAVVNTDPTLDAGLKQALAAHPDTTIDTSDKNDVVASASFAPAGPTVGRVITPHLTFLNGLARAAYESVTPSNVAARRANDILRRLGAAGALPNGPNTTFGDITDVDGAIELAEAVGEAAASDVEARKKLISADRSFGLDRLYALLGNQPQFFVSGLYHERSNEIGPDETSFRATYEWSAVNLNAYYAVAGKKCRTAVSNECLDAYRSFVKDNAARIDTAPRFSFSVEYAQVRANDIAVPAHQIALHTSRTRKFIGSAAYGRVLRRGEDQRDSRIDASVSYEDVTNDPDKDDRLVASVIFTQKINDSFSLPLGIVFANHQQYLPESDREINVHVGLVYKLKPSAAK